MFHIKSSTGLVKNSETIITLDERALNFEAKFELRLTTVECDICITYELGLKTRPTTLE